MLDKFLNAKKISPVFALIKTKKRLNLKNKEIKVFGNKHLYILYGDWKEINIIFNLYENIIIDKQIINFSHNQLFPLLNYLETSARIEPGAIIRSGVTIKDKAIVLMGAVINIGAVIGEESMIDMNAVIGSGAIIGKKVHVGAASVVAGILEPYSDKPVIIEDNVMIGAGAVILEGVHIKKNAVIGAGSIVLHDVEENAVYAGNPAKFIKYRDLKTDDKTIILDLLRK